MPALLCRHFFGMCEFMGWFSFIILILNDSERRFRNYNLWTKKTYMNVADNVKNAHMKINIIQETTSLPNALLTFVHLTIAK